MIGFAEKLASAFSDFMQLCLYIVGRAEKEKEAKKRSVLMSDPASEWLRQFGGTDKRQKKPPTSNP